ncbi:MFS transporter [Pseudonocardia xinjiangensis]|uniref:MFS transporter n=1 Tax=Pseudonocardia xinjiangensis TaxID=75289 RepID=A0ABX1RAA6_9PSEU|nr:MFS transporter [Pseudonocardia xinjiangensis]NMH76957.1 MFS transporter [Pseudonocardia xinjiangensis]
MTDVLADAADGAAAHRGSAGLTLAAAALGFFVLTLDTQVVTVAMPVIGTELNGGITSLQWVVSGYTLMLAALLLSAGSLSDRIGASRAFAVGLAAFTAASAACGVAPELGVLVAARFLQGAAGAVLLPASLALVRQAYPTAVARARAVAVWTSAGGAAMAAGPLVGGLLTTTLGWRAVFYVNLPIGLVGLLALIRSPRSLPRRAPFDLPGQLSATLALAAVTYAVIERSVVATAVFCVAAAAFVIVERRSTHPMIPPRLVRLPAVAVPAATGLALNFAFYGAVFLLALYFEQVHGLSALETGLMFLPMTALITVVNLLAGRLGTRCGPRLPMALGQVVLLGGVCGLLALREDTPLVVQAAVLLPFGIGGGLAVPALTAVLLESVDAGRAGLAAGLLNAGRQFGGALGVALFGSLAAGGAVVAGLHMGAIVGAAVLAVTTTATVVLVRPRTTMDPSDTR